jgi:hypothetical protein
MQYRDRPVEIEPLAEPARRRGFRIDLDAKRRILRF